MEEIAYKPREYLTLRRRTVRDPSGTSNKVFPQWQLWAGRRIIQSGWMGDEAGRQAALIAAAKRGYPTFVGDPDGDRYQGRCYRSLYAV